MPVSLNSLGLDALRVTQRSLSTVGHNIANANTPGYSRQRVELATTQPLFEGGFHLGQGVTIQDVTRIYDEIVNDQIELQRANRAQAADFASLASRVDTLLSDPDTGLGQPMQQFFAQLESYSTNPGDTVEGRLLLDASDGLATKFNDLYTGLDTIRRELNVRMGDLVGEINRLSESVAELNQRVLETPTSVPANDLLDQRDLVLRELSELVGITTVRQDGQRGPVNVYLSGGHAMVTGTTTSFLSTGNNAFDAGQLEVVNQAGSQLSDFIDGGRLGGLLQFRDGMLTQNLNALGRLAVGIAESFNAQHALGLDSAGNLGQDFFVPASPGVASSDSNAGAGTVTAAISAIGALTTSDYVLTFDGGNDYTLRRQSDGAAFAIDTGGASPFTTASIDGFTLTITAGATLGDQFRISPTNSGARDFELNLTSPDLIAAASPVRAEVPLANVGEVTLTIDRVASVANLPLTGAPVAGDLTLTFDALTNTYTLGPDPLTEGPLAFDPDVDANGRSYSLLGGDLEITLAGRPRDGDQVVIRHNSGSAGDNSNVLAMLDLEDQRLLEDSSATFSQSHAAQLANIGSQARDAERSEETFGAMLEQAETAREQIAGVNLDEEAADLLRYQQAYSAAAEILRVADQLFQTLVGVIRG